MATKPTNRLRELDFLRGLAILLVLLRHRIVLLHALTMGWIGVDLFFVLSGFLVSGLLFKEYLKFGDIKPKLFFIRRGFKIYPIYYIFYIPYFIVLAHYNVPNYYYVLADLFFIQNYVLGYGYTYNASWSLAVEEHFYLGICILLWWAVKSKKLKLAKDSDLKSKLDPFQKVIIGLMLLCLILRITYNIHAHQSQYLKNFTMTHFRIDSLLAGVFISYLYYFKFEQLKSFYFKHRLWLLITALTGLIWTPFIDPVPSFFVKTFGFSSLYISFGIILIAFLLEGNINKILNRFFTAPVVNMVSKIGYSSYSIYVIHVLVNFLTVVLFIKFNLYFNNILLFFITSLCSILIGMLMTKYVEKYFLRLRDKYYPARA